MTFAAAAGACSSVRSQCCWVLSASLGWLAAAGASLCWRIGIFMVFSICSQYCWFTQVWMACCSRCKPQLTDSQWQSVPQRLRQFPGGIPASYPTERVPIVQHPALFERLDTEALFFAFYYQPGSYQQYLAARELKRQSWRYHKQHAAWFQVRTPPMYICRESVHRASQLQSLTLSIDELHLQNINGTTP
jgi:hypothetical protein